MRLDARRARLSSCQAPSCSPCCTVGGLSGSSKCRRGPHACPCPGTHHRSGFRGAASVQELAELSILRLYLVVVKVVHEML